MIGNYIYHLFKLLSTNPESPKLESARPSYHPLALAHIHDVTRARSSVNIVELVNINSHSSSSLKYLAIRIGAGTGIFTRALLTHPDWSSNIKAIKAIEPSPGMRDVFSQAVKDDRVTISEGTFEKTGVDDQWADLIIIAQVRPILLIRD